MSGQLLLLLHVKLVADLKDTHMHDHHRGLVPQLFL